MIGLILVGVIASALLTPVASAGVPSCSGEPATHVGTGGADVLRGTSGDDVFVGRAGNDRLIGRGGNDLFCAGGGDDVVKGGGGDDTAKGQGGNDRLVGGPGEDLLLGGGGDDTIDGGLGVDTLNGGRGTDDCTNGETLRNCEGPITEFDVDGSWAGTTSQAKDISFDVADHALTMISISYAWSGPGCTSESTTTITFGTPLAIADNIFDLNSNPGTLSLQVHGEFTSDADANGTFSASDSGGFCPGSASGTWTATKQ